MEQHQIQPLLRILEHGGTTRGQRVRQVVPFEPRRRDGQHQFGDCRRSTVVVRHALSRLPDQHLARPFAKSRSQTIEPFPRQHARPKPAWQVDCPPQTLVEQLPQQSVMSRAE